MSIFKETFRGFVKNQLGVRRQIQAQSVKDNNALVWQQTKQCVIRATSLVDYNQDINISLNEGFESLNGSQLSKRFVLQGGIGFKGGINGAYGDPLLASEGDNIEGYGQVPMPGITSLDIETKTAYGSLRSAKLSFVVHSLRQLEIMELLYLRPGYPLVIEWGWSPYIDNSNSIISNLPTIAEILETDGVDLFSKNITQNDLYKAINQLRIDSNGNADGFLGFINNFGFKARPDGGFDCYCEISSMGESLDSLKIIPFKIPGPENLPVEFVVEETDEEIKKPDAVKAIILLLLKYAEKLDTDSVSKPGFWNDVDNSSDVTEAVINDIKQNFPLLQKFTSPLEKQLALDNFILRKDQEIQSAAFNSFINTSYIRWDLFAWLLSEYAIPKNEKGEVTVEVNTVRFIPDGNNPPKVDPLYYVQFNNSDNKTQLDISCDPAICLLPHMFADESLGDTLSSETGWGRFWEGAWDLVEGSNAYLARGFRTAFTGGPTSTVAFDSNGEQNQNFIGGIFLNIRNLMKAYDATIRDQEDPDLGSFIKKVWDDVNIACPMHNFIFKVDNDFPNQAYIIDLPVDHQDVANIEEIFEVPVQAKDSIVRDYNLEAKIPDALKSTIAIHAQDPGDPQDIEDVTFNAFNRAIKNRLFYGDSNDPSVRTTFESPLAKLKRDRQESMVAFNKLKRTYFETINGAENSNIEDSTSQIDDLKTALKKAQTNVMQEYNLETKETNASSVIPLEFSMTLDGISGIVIGNVFKIDTTRLPRAYRGNVEGGANIGFVVFGESQKINAGQDWTTDINGKMIILPGENYGIEKPDSNNFDESEPIYFDEDLRGNEDFEISDEQTLIDPGLDSVSVGDQIYVKINGVFDSDGNIIFNDSNGNPQGYTYIREEPRVDNDTGFFDLDDNIIGAIKPGNKGLLLGTVTEIANQGVTGVLGEREVIWYKFNMDENTFSSGEYVDEFTNKGAGKGDGDFISDSKGKRQGWVRIDVVQTIPESTRSTTNPPPPPPPTNSNTPNADRLRAALNQFGYKEKGEELSNGGDITPEMADYTIAVFRKIKRKMPDLKIRATGGNDQYHQGLSYRSRHKDGRAVDFTISPATETNIRKVDKILRGFSAGENDLARFINEYDDPTKAATGKHFHMSWGKGTEASSTIRESIAQADRGEIEEYRI